MATTAIPTESLVPAGTWVTDPVHSSFEFSVKHMVVATFRARLTDFDVTLTAEADGPALRGTARVASVEVRDENLHAHLLSPDFFDASRHPEVTYRSTRILREDGDAVRVEGELTLKGVTRPVTLTGTLVGPVVGLGDGERLGLELETTIDRRQFGLRWNAPLPKGGFAVGDDVRLHAHVELVRG
jgi:polyisoprenoid-binding protein YceI